MQRTASLDTVSLGYKLRQFEHMHFSCNKGNEKGVGHFVKCLSWHNPLTRRVEKQLLDNNASDGNMEECPGSIQASLENLSHGDDDKIVLSGNAADIGGGGVLDSLADALKALNVCSVDNPDHLVANCTIHALQLQLAQAIKPTCGEGGLDKDNVLQVLHSVHDLEESMNADVWKCTSQLSNECTLQHLNSEPQEGDDEFATNFNAVKSFYPFKVKALPEDALCCI